MAFGVFDTGFGLAWFLGSGLMGILYEVFLAGSIVFSVVPCNWLGFPCSS